VALISVQLLTGFDSSTPIQTEQTLFGLRVLVSLVPLLGAVIGFLIFSRFPINYKVFMEQQAKLEALHEKRLKDLKNLDS